MAVVNHPITTPLTFGTATVNAIVTGSSDTDNLSPQVGEVTFTPSTQAGSWTGVGGNVVQAQSIATWTMTLGCIQDLAATGMLRWLLTNEGKKAAFTIVLVTGVTVTITATISPAQIGGATGNPILNSTVTLACDGKPVFS